MPKAAATPRAIAFIGSLEHLLAALERIDALVRARVAAFRASLSQDEQFRGLYLSEPEIDALLAAPFGMPAWLAAAAGQDASLVERLDVLSRDIGERERLALVAGVDLRLARLARCFALSPLEVDVLLVCIAGELETRYEKLYAYLQDDVTRVRPSVDLVLTLLLPDPRARIAERARLAADAPLRAARLLDVFDDPARLSPPFIGKFLRTDERIVAFLLGSDQPDARIAPFVRLAGGGERLDTLLLGDEARRGLAQVARQGDDADGTQRETPAGSRFVVHLQGPRGAGKRTVAQALCGERGERLLIVDLERLHGDADANFAAQLALVDREARLLNAAIFWNGFDALLEPERGGALHTFLRAAALAPGLSFLAGEADWLPTRELRGAGFASVRLGRPAVAERIAMWRKAAQAHGLDHQALDVLGIATKFRFTPGQIDDSMHTASNLAAWRHGEHTRIASQDLYDACRMHSNRALAALAQKIAPRFRWDDIVLPADRMTQLREICNHIKYRNQVFNEWGFERKLASSKGLSFLFAGPSGTGKTMAASIIAAELKLDLYKIDLSMVVSKFIGETEKNLARIFDEAETANAVLFFDEADSLFGKRSEVKDAHDRYANIEVGYLLQRIEEYEGIAILATNFRRNMDEAFVRRLQFTVDFPLPGIEDRHRMWVSVLPDEVPRDTGLDLALMARRYTLTGGNIRNVALAAAFLAADEGDMIRMSHLIAATQREYQKMGKLIGDGEFEHRVNPP